MSPPSEQSLSGSLNSSRMHTECVNTLFALSVSQCRQPGYESFVKCPGLDYYKSFLLTGFTAGPITSLYIQLRSKMSLDPHEWTSNIKCNSRVDNNAAFRQVKKIPTENQLSPDFQIFHKNQSKSSDGALFWFWNIKKTTKFRKFSSYLNQNRDFCSLEVKKKISTKPCLDRNLSFCGNIRLILNKHTLTSEKNFGNVRYSIFNLKQSIETNTH